MRRFATLALGVFVFGPTLTKACAHITDDDERLACFDAARDCASIRSSSDRLECLDNAYPEPGDELVSDEQSIPDPVIDSNVAPTTAPRPDSNNVESVPAALYESPEEFGEETTITASGVLTAEITAVTTNAFEIDFIHLDTGHVWRENENSRVRFKAGQKVSIEEGILGSFNLTVEGSTKRVKVNRVK